MSFITENQLNKWYENTFGKKRWSTKTIKR